MIYTLSASNPASGVGLFDLFLQSFDAFTVLLLLGSIIAVAVIFRCVMEVRAENVLPVESERRIRQFLRDGKLDELEAFVSSDNAFVSKVVHAAIISPGTSPTSARDAAELAASEQCASWFRKIDPLSVIGNLGPLLGLAGTVWGMIYAFTSLGQTGGQASAAALSAGIAKALFHTLLGLLLAVPSLTVYGIYRSRVDQLCNRALLISAELVEMLPVRTGKSSKGNA